MLRRICILLSVLFLFPITAYGAGVSVSAGSAVVIDAQTHTVLYEKSAYDSRAMASTTKIMTCLLACESNKCEDDVVITSQMLDGAIGSLVYLKEGDKISFLDLIKGAMLASGNDCANAIAVCVS